MKRALRSASLPAELRRYAWRATAIASFAVAGCATIEPIPAAPARSLGDAIARDAVSLTELIQPGGLLRVLVMCAVVFAGIGAINTFVQVLWRTGFDARRRLSAYAGGVQVALVGGLAYTLLSRLLSEAPVLGSLLLCLLAPAALFVAAPAWQNLSAGVGILLKRPFREGDHLRVGSFAGIVRRCGLTRVHLSAAGGATVYLPARLVSLEAVIIDQVRNSVAVAATVEVGKDAISARLDLLRRAAWLSPYRSPDSPVDVVLEPEGTARVVIQVAPRAQREASAHLLSSLEDCVHGSIK